MISPVSSIHQVQPVTAAATKAPSQPTAKPAEDTVHLSPQASAAAARDSGK